MKLAMDVRRCELYRRCGPRSCSWTSPCLERYDHDSVAFDQLAEAIRSVAGGATHIDSSVAE